MADFRALCAELTDYLSLINDPPHELLVKAQSALAKDQPTVCYAVSHSASGYPIAVYTDENAAIAGIKGWAKHESYNPNECCYIEYPLNQNAPQAN